MSRWFRAYDEALDDPKIQRLSDALFKTWFNLLCLASRNNGALPEVSEIAFALRLSEKDAGKRIGELIESGLIDRDGETLRPHNWNHRQFSSDVSNERVKRHRERKKTATGNVDVTLHDAQGNGDCNVTLNSPFPSPPTPPLSITPSDSETEAEAEPPYPQISALPTAALGFAENQTITELDLVESQCRQALGEQSPCDVVIGPMAEIVRKFGQERVILALASESRRRRKKPIKTWKLWAQIVSESLIAAEGVDTHKSQAPPHTEPIERRVDMKYAGVKLPESILLAAIERWKKSECSWLSGWGPPPNRSKIIMEFAAERGIVIEPAEETEWDRREAAEAKKEREFDRMEPPP